MRTKEIRETETEKIRRIIVTGIANWLCKVKVNGNYNNGAIYIMAALIRAGYKIVKK